MSVVASSGQGKVCAYLCMVSAMVQHPGILDLTQFTDEAWFHLSEYNNSQNTSLWVFENPHAIHEKP